MNLKAIKSGALARLLGISSLVILTTGCNTLPMEEYAQFSPAIPSKRILNQVRVSWEVRDDVADFCAKAKGMGKEQAFLTPPVACAIWNTPLKECTVVTGTRTSHVALGHEVRHCFEGHFH